MRGVAHEAYGQSKTCPPRNQRNKCTSQEEGVGTDGRQAKYKTCYYRFTYDEAGDVDEVAGVVYLCRTPSAWTTSLHVHILPFELEQWHRLLDDSQTCPVQNGRQPVP